MDDYLMNDLKLLVKKTHPDAIIPTRSTNNSAAYDLYSIDEGWILARDKVIVGTGIAVSFPKLPEPYKVYGSIRSRSGLSAECGIEVGAGVIDEDYRSEIGVILYNHNNEASVFYNQGDRIAQLVLEVH